MIGAFQNDFCQISAGFGGCFISSLFLTGVSGPAHIAGIPHQFTKEHSSRMENSEASMEHLLKSVVGAEAEL